MGNTVGPRGTAAPPGQRARLDGVLLVLILLAALPLRFYLAQTETLVHDEEATSIPLSKTISLSPGAFHLPIRGENHPALPAYVVKASSTLFGTSLLGYRFFHLLAGLATIALIFRLARQWQGPAAGFWAAALVAFNEYHLAVSARATAHSVHLFLVALAVFAFARFLATMRAAWLYAAGASAGLAFYCKEHSALLVPVFALVLLHPAHRHWWRTPHLYLAASVFALVIAPDVVWNLTRGPDMIHITYRGEPDTIAQATYGSHLQRIGGLGLSPYPSMFYLQRPVTSLHVRLTGRELRNETPEYPSMNPLLGLLLLIGVLAMTAGPVRGDPIGRFLSIAFFVVFAFFTFIRPGNPPGRLDPVSWIWVEATLVPAAILTGVTLATARGPWRVFIWLLGGGAMLYAVGWTMGLTARLL